MVITKHLNSNYQAPQVSLTKTTPDQTFAVQMCVNLQGKLNGLAVLLIRRLLYKRVSTCRASSTVWLCVCPWPTAASRTVFLRWRRPQAWRRSTSCSRCARKGREKEEWKVGGGQQAARCVLGKGGKRGMKSWRRSTSCSMFAREGREKRNEKLEEVNKLLDVC